MPQRQAVHQRGECHTSRPDGVVGTAVGVQKASAHARAMERPPRPSSLNMCPSRRPWHEEVARNGSVMESVPSIKRDNRKSCLGVPAALTTVATCAYPQHHQCALSVEFTYMCCCVPAEIPMCVAVCRNSCESQGVWGALASAHTHV